MTKQHLYLLSRAIGEPLMIVPAKLQVLLYLFREERPELAAIQVIEGEVPQEYMAARKEPAPPPEDKAIAVIEIMGSLMHRTRGLEGMSGATSYERIGDQLRALRADPRVGGILLRIDSPGGEVAGAYDLAKTVRETAQMKPVWSVIDGMGLSAGYLIASQTSKILLSTHASVGSIGIIMVHLDVSGADKQNGREYTVLKRGGHKDDFNPHAPLSDSAKEFANSLLDDEYKLFVDHVASARSLPEKKVRATEASIYYDDEAMKLGLADGQASYYEALDDMHKAIAAPVSVAQTQGGVPMADPVPTPVPPASPPASPTISDNDYREIAALCTIARKPHLAAQFITQRKTVSEVRALLMQADADEDANQEVFSAFAPNAGLAESLLRAKPKQSLAERMRLRLGMEARH